MLDRSEKRRVAELCTNGTARRLDLHSRPTPLLHASALCVTRETTDLVHFDLVISTDGRIRPQRSP